MNSECYNLIMMKWGTYGVEVFDYETDMWRVVAEFETIEEAVNMADNSWDGRLMAACMAIDPCFTLGGHRVIDYLGNTVWEL